MSLTFDQLLISCNEIVTLYFVFPFLIILGCYYSRKLRGIQIRQLPNSIRYLLSQSKESSGNITPFQAISAVLAGNLGTGNISGMAVAISTGGPGALLWMWVVVFLGTVIQFVSCFLGSRFRLKNADGEFVGGPMYYLRDGTSSPKLAAFFALCTIFGAFTVGNLAQIHSIALPMKAFNISTMTVGVVMALFVAAVIFGGIQRFAKVAETIVPFKAVLYLGCAVVILVMQYEKLPEAFKLIWTSAFSTTSAVGGVMGYSLSRAISTGFERGIFATDAGTGIVPILQASAKTDHPVITGIISLIAPVVVMIVCTSTSLVLITTGAWQSGLESTNMVTYAFETGLQSSVGKYVVIFSLLLFAYTTILAWSFCLDKAVEYLFGKRALSFIRFLFIACVPLGTILHVSVVWALADICISVMVLVNLYALYHLRKMVLFETEEFLSGTVPKIDSVPVQKI